MARKHEPGPKVVTGAFQERPSPPENMKAEQAEIWNNTVASEPVNWFQSQAQRDILRMYCAAVYSAKMIQMFIDDYPIAMLATANGTRHYNNLCRLRRDETNSAVSLATKLRITNQSRYDRKLAATMTRGQSVESKPWSK